ncbi:hypothetical protein JZ751_027514 [Albula glossodonta]|uniref:Uncharacterized protein n=1 Tax=Albula glossodonta TaxID=121402 RepID=A0A8T2NJN2_9TELE|nr:hypothetical protein JZ751_027514 [Albula glossodonta]
MIPVDLTNELNRLSSLTRLSQLLPHQMKRQIQFWQGWAGHNVGSPYLWDHTSNLMFHLLDWNGMRIWECRVQNPILTLGKAPSWHTPPVPRPGPRSLCRQTPAGFHLWSEHGQSSASGTVGGMGGSSLASFLSLLCVEIFPAPKPVATHISIILLPLGWIRVRARSAKFKSDCRSQTCLIWLMPASRTRSAGQLVLGTDYPSAAPSPCVTLGFESDL